MKVLRLGAAVIGLAVGGARATGQAATVVVPDAPSCAKCAIVVRPVVTLGSADGPGSLSTMPNSINVDGRRRYWVTQEGEMPMVFDAAGKFVASIGRNGEGPGEFIYPYSALRLPGDSMLVFDRGRATVVGPDLRPTRSIRVPVELGAGPVVRWPDLVLGRRGMFGRDYTQPTILRARFSDPAAEVIGAFGPDRGDMDVRRPLFQVLGNVSQGGIWTADGSDRYRLSHWSTEGRLERSLERKPEWYLNPADGSLHSMAQPRISAIMEDSTGLIWVFANVSRPGWRDAVPKMAPGVSEIAVRKIPYERLLRTTVEVIDPRSARVVALRVFDAWIIAALPNGRAAACSIDEQDGLPRISIMQLSLHGR